MTTVLERGSAAPDFNLPTNSDGQVSLNDYAGKFLVLYFYPKDLTPGCTTQGQDFTSLKDDFNTANAHILGVSRDSVSRHEKFAEKSNIGVRLASDENGLACEAYGVWVQKQNYGKTYMGIERSTFLIGPDGNIIEIWRKVRVKDHAQKVLEFIQSLKQSD